MNFATLIWIWVGCSMVTAGPVFASKFRALLPRHLDHAASIPSLISPAPLPADTQTIAKLQTASGSNIDNNSTIAFASGPPNAQRPTFSSQVLASVAAITASAAATSATISRDVGIPAASPKVIGIVQAIPNNPALSPPLTSIPPIEPAKLLAISAELASINGTPAGQIAVTSSLNDTTTVSFAASAVDATPSTQPSEDITITLTIVRTLTASVPAAPSAGQGGFDESGARGGRHRPHRHHSNAAVSASAAELSPCVSSSADGLDLPVPTLPPESTITIQAAQPSGVVIIPFDPNASISGSVSAPGLQIANVDNGKTVTITVTNRIAEITKLVTQTVTLI